MNALTITRPQISEPLDKVDSALDRKEGAPLDGVLEVAAAKKSVASCKNLKVILEAGGIPDQLREEWRLVHEDSPAGKLFQKEIENLARELYSAKALRPDADKTLSPLRDYLVHDFDKEPVRFLLSDAPYANAWYVKVAKPPLIVITKAAFEKDSKGRILIKTWSDLARIVGHEMTHHKWGARGCNSKVEEGAAEAVPLSLLYYADRDPNDSQQQLSRMNDFHRKIPFEEMVDPHPIPKTLRAIYGAALTFLEQNHGDLAPKGAYGQEETARRSLLPPDVLEALREGAHTSHLDNFKERIGNYSELSRRDKVKLLQRYFEELIDGEPYAVRLDDLQMEIRSLVSTEPVDSKLRQEIATFADKILDCQAQDSSTDLRAVYLGLGALSEGKGVPLGRLVPLLEITREFVNASIEEGENLGKLRTNAERLTSIAYQESSLLTEGGQRLLRSLSWPTFAYPDLDKVEDPERRRDGKYKPVLVEWRNLRESAKSDSVVAEAATLIGLGWDPLVYGKLCSSPDLLLRHLQFGVSDEPSLGLPKTPFISFSAGPKRKGRSFDSIKDLVVTDRGKVVGHGRASDGAVIRLRGFSKSGTESTSEAMTIALKDSAVETLIVEAVRRIAKGDSQYVARFEEWLPHVSETPHRFIGTELLALDPIRVLRINESGIANELEFDMSKRSSVHALRDLKKTSSFEDYRRVIRTFFDLPLSEGGETWHSYMIRSGQRDDIVGEIIVADSSDHFTHFLLDIDSSVISQREKFEVINKRLTNVSYLKSSLKARLGLLAQQVDGFPESPSVTNIILYLREQYPSGKQLGTVTLAAGVHFLVSSVKASGLPAIPELVALQEAGILNEAFKEYRPRSNVYGATVAIPELTKYVAATSLSSGIHALTTLGSLECISPVTLKEGIESCITRLRAEDIPALVRMELVEKLLANRLTREAFHLKSLAEMWTESAIVEFGIDDGSEDYFTRVSHYLDVHLDSKIPLVVRQDLLEQFGRLSEAQRPLSYFLEKSLQMKESLVQNGLAVGLIGETLLHSVRSKPRERSAMLEYLLSGGSAEDTRIYLHRIESILNPFRFVAMRDDDQRDIYLDFSGDFHAQTLSLETQQIQEMLIRDAQTLHRNFREFSLEVRAVAIKELLVGDAERIPDEIFEQSLDRLFPDGIQYGAIARDLLSKHIRSFNENTRDLALGALLVACDKSEGRNVSAGEIVTIFAEAMGMAYLKVLQTAEGNFALPEDFRKDLSKHAKRLKFDGARPTRWEVWRIIDSLEPQALTGVTRVGSVLGSASMNIAVNVELAGDGGEEVLSLSRPYARERAQFGFQAMSRTAQMYEEGSPFRETIIGMVEGAEKRAEIEVDCVFAEPQYKTANGMYHGEVAKIAGRTLRFTSAEVTQTGRGYYRMTKVPGVHFAELPEETEAEFVEKSQIAELLYVKELHNIFNGQFDSDRHGGQMKIYGDTVGHFDFKGMTLQEWSREDFEQMAEVCSLLLKGFLSNKSGAFSSHSLVELEVDLKAKYGNVSELVREVQKAFLSLAEISGYLTPEQQSRSALSALVRGVHPDLVAGVMERADEFLEFVPKLYRPIAKVTLGKLLQGKLSLTAVTLFAKQLGYNGDLIELRREG